MNDQFIQLVLDLTRKKKFTISDIINLRYYILLISKDLEFVKESAKRIEEISMVAYGFRENPYAGLQSLLVMKEYTLERLIPEETIVLELFRGMGPNKEVSKDYWKIKEIRDAFLDLKKFNKKIKTAYSEQFEIFKKALRFEESPTTQCQDDEVIFLDIVTRKEERYRISDWTYHWYTSDAKEEDWPIIRETYPEEFV